MGTVRFVHAADLHLDAPFKGIDAEDPRVREELVASTYRALDAIVETCISRNADFLVVAGDAYNHAEKSLRAQFAFRDACARLADAGIRVFVARGNHDPASGWSAGLAMPENVHVFSEREVERVPVVRDGEEVCAVYGRSFRTAAETENLARGFARAPADRIAVGVLHANVGGRTDYEPYAPCSLDDLRAAKMDYWALGHIHKPELLSDDPAVAYAGCAQGLDPSETGLRGCRVVTVDEHGVTSELVPTAAVLWQSEAVDCSQAETVADVHEGLVRALDRVRETADGRPTVVRVELTGRSAAHRELRRPGVLRDLVAEVRADAVAREPWMWLDRAYDRTRPAIDVEAVRCGADFAGDFVRLADEIADDPALAEALVGEAAERVLASLDRDDVPAIDAQSIVERARDLVLDRLLAEEGR